MASDSSVRDARPVSERLPAEAKVETVESAAEAEEEAAEEEVRAKTTHFLLFQAVPSWLVSMVVHMVGLMILALINIGGMGERAATVLNVVNASELEQVEEFDMIEEIEPLDVEAVSSEAVTEMAAEVPQEVTEVGVATDLDAAPVEVDLMEFGETTAPREDLMKELGAIGGTGLEGRGSAMRGQMVKRYGGSAASEAAVAMALQWFAEHQLPDGSWSFDHRGGRCAGRCKDPGDIRDSFTAATGMALLPFLGAGQTHMEGKYKKNVAQGLAFLIRSMKSNGSLMEGGGRMYGHGICSIVLCEAYAMTNDRKLMAPAQASLNFIVYAQDPIGGGWRYQPHQPGDTSVVGWQLMALKSGHMAYLRVPAKTILGANKFLDSVQADGGAKYGYTFPGQKPSTTAVGLLCRMYLGWKKDNPALERGVRFLSQQGPSDTDMYYNYYATQVMHHWGGELWDKWNSVMRDQLVNSQVKSGHARGSWDPRGGGHANQRGGRLYFTSMATMILEVYYRHMPIYTKDAAEDEFPL